MHLGNARTFLVNWALARQRAWRIMLRIEDLDTPRNKPGAAEGLVQTLQWLGLDWDEGPIRQSSDLEPYRQAMRRLAEAGHVFECSLTRSQIETAASAPQAGVHEDRYPPSLRPEIVPRHFVDVGSNWRFVTQPGTVRFNDGFLGPQLHDPSETVGDFVVWTKRGQPAYQLAVVVDDARHGVTQVVRGADLLDSTARQILLQRALGLRHPRHTHLPLVVGPDGRRLAKRHGDTRIEQYRTLGVTPQRIIGLIAHWCGLPSRREMGPDEFLDSFSLDRIPNDTITFTHEDDEWLRAK